MKKKKGWVYWLCIGWWWDGMILGCLKLLVWCFNVFFGWVFTETKRASKKNERIYSRRKINRRRKMHRRK